MKTEEIPPACTQPEHHQFDFWIGEWDVYAGATLAGTNSITREHGGCVIVERWTGSRGLTGTSLNVYLPERRQWHQSWADSGGTLLLMFGVFSDGAMRLATEAPKDGGSIDRTIWTPNPDGTVRQVWERSDDGVRTWIVVFDGLYRRKAQTTSPAAATRD